MVIIYRLQIKIENTITIRKIWKYTLKAEFMLTNFYHMK